MARKGEEGGRWTGHGPSGGPGDTRPGDGTGWLDPAHAGRLLGRPDPFARRRSLGPKGYRRPDDRIRDDVCERIARSGIDAREVEVAVEAGEVTLTGTVESRDDKRTLEDVTDDVFGVEDVHNRLRLQRRAPTRERAPRRAAGPNPDEPAPATPRPRRRGPRGGRNPGRSH